MWEGGEQCEGMTTIYYLEPDILMSELVTYAPGRRMQHPHLILVGRQAALLSIIVARAPIVARRCIALHLILFPSPCQICAHSLASRIHHARQAGLGRRVLCPFATIAYPASRYTVAHIRTTAISYRHEVLKLGEGPLPAIGAKPTKVFERAQPLQQR